MRKFLSKRGLQKIASLFRFLLVKRVLINSELVLRETNQVLATQNGSQENPQMAWADVTKPENCQPPNPMAKKQNSGLDRILSRRKPHIHRKKAL
jgi:hypothetical protein